jgi:hypothetical protein
MKFNKFVKPTVLGVCVLFCLAFVWSRAERFERLIQNCLVSDLPISEKQTDIALTDREKHLISHVKASIENAQKGISKLNRSILKIKGMSSLKTRHLLNNLCSLPDTNYLEIGCWKGSTWISSLYGNKGTIKDAVAIDNWSEELGARFQSPKEAFSQNCSQFLGAFPYRTYSSDCFSVDLKSVFHNPVNIYLYDGDHTALSQEKAFTYYNDVLDDSFIAMVDDWNWQEVKDGTRAAFEKLNYQVLYETALPAKFSGDKKNWWNGFYIAVIRKQKTLSQE